MDVSICQRTHILGIYWHDAGDPNSETIDPWSLENERRVFWTLNNKRNDLNGRARVPCCKCNWCTEINAVKGEYISVRFSNYDNVDRKR
jgi:hypothetical protein